ncbi:MAG: hypothetical protein ACFB21_01560 [Opitutales bacterium]
MRSELVLKNQAVMVVRENSVMARCNLFLDARRFSCSFGLRGAFHYIQDDFTFLSAPEIPACAALVLAPTDRLRRDTAPSDMGHALD